jgi:uncharacterized protein YndB with AHSA1/START domain
MRTVTVNRDIAAPRSAVWAVLADFANIADWNSGVKASVDTGAGTQGLGAKRHCDLSLGGLDETITDWQPEEKMVVDIHSVQKLPMRSAMATFTLGEGESVTPTEIRYEYTPKWGFLGKLLDRQFTSGFNGFLGDLETAALKG